MKFALSELHVSFKKSKEIIVFTDFTYFYGPMGAGKSTIARLVDYCLGGHLGDKEMTPALQSEFVSASLTLRVKDTELNLRRDIGSTLIRANWRYDNEQYEVMVPSRSGDGEVIPGTGIEVISDLIYVLSGRIPPKFERAKSKKILIWLD